MATRRRSKKPTPLKELAFLLVVVSGFLAVTQVNLDTSNLMSMFGVILFFALLASIGLYLFFLQKQRAKQKALRAVEMTHIDEMPGIEFEKYVATLLNSRGYKTKLTPVNDYGVDIVATKDGIKTAVQVKRYKKQLDQKPVREAIAGKSVRKYDCTKAMVVTNSAFTRAAKFLASEGGCTLVDREVLGEWVLEFQNAGDQLK